jgi:hypothetical protein
MTSFHEEQCSLANELLKPTTDFEPIRAVDPIGPLPLSKIYYKPSIGGEELTSEFTQELVSNLPAVSLQVAVSDFEPQTLAIPGESLFIFKFVIRIKIFLLTPLCVTVFLMIGDFCDIITIIRLSQTCKHLFHLFDNPYYW